MLSYWEQTQYITNIDYLIIGAGFSGMWTAIELNKKKPNASILIVDRGIMPSGASSKNAGFSCFGSPTELIADAQLMGKEQMWQIAFKRYEGIRKIHNTFSYKKIDYENSGGFECLNKNDFDIVSKNLEWLNSDFYNLTSNKNCFQLETQVTQHGLFHFEAVANNKLEGTLNPVKLLKQLSYQVREKQINIMYNINIEKVECNTNECIAFSNIGAIKAKKIIYCNNAFIKEIDNSIDVLPQRGQVFVTTPIDNLKLNGSYHSDEGFIYFRNIDNRILIGGARNSDFNTEQTASFDNTAIIENQLKNFVNKHILNSNTCTFEFGWSGIMGFSKNKQPIVKQLRNGNEYCLVGLNGIGVALAPILAEELVSLID
jgi:gamma-glutamylputrescine oxidase